MTQKRVTVRGAARDAVRQDKVARIDAVKPKQPPKTAKGWDSFINGPFNFGVGTQNPLSSATYQFNPITRNRILLEWMHRGSWICGAVVDFPADDMTRSGIDFLGEIDPDDVAKIEEMMVVAKDWTHINSALKWQRLYGGCILVMMIDGHDYSKPLRMETVGKDQYKGLAVVDRWNCMPSLENLVQLPGPDMGLPMYYRIPIGSPALAGVNIHHSRVIRLEGSELPYLQRLTENLWGESTLERLYDRLIAFDSATTGAAQLVYKSYLRWIKVKGLRDLLAQGGLAAQGFMKYMEMVRMFQGAEGLTILDDEDDMQEGGSNAFSGLGDALSQFGQQLAGASGMPLVRLFGQSPTGFNSGDTDVRMYYDTIKKMQNRDLLVGVTKIVRCQAQSLGITLSEGFGIAFKSLWQLTEKDKVDISKATAETLTMMVDSGLMSDQTAMKEFKQSSMITGIGSNLTEKEINAAEDIPEDPPTAEELAGVKPSQGGTNSSGDLPATPEI